MPRSSINIRRYVPRDLTNFLARLIGDVNGAVAMCRPTSRTLCGVRTVRGRPDRGLSCVTYPTRDDLHR